MAATLDEPWKHGGTGSIQTRQANAAACNCKHSKSLPYDHGELCREANAQNRAMSMVLLACETARAAFHIARSAAQRPSSACWAATSGAEWPLRPPHGTHTELRAKLLISFSLPIPMHASMHPVHADVGGLNLNNPETTCQHWSGASWLRWSRLEAKHVAQNTNVLISSKYAAQAYSKIGGAADIWQRARAVRRRAPGHIRLEAADDGRLRHARRAGRLQVLAGGRRASGTPARVGFNPTLHPAVWDRLQGIELHC